MKVAIAFVVVAILVCISLSEAGFVQKMRFEQAVVSAAGKPCICMSTQACNGGEVNSK